jgi:16S rRNA processing protein RimM
MRPQNLPGSAGRVCVAQIGAAHGIRGELRLKSFTAEPMAVAQYGPLESEDGARQFEIASLRPGNDILIARLKGVADRTAAEALCNIRLYVPRARLAEPEDGEFYHADLVGLAAFDASDRRLGAVTAVHNFGAGDLLEVAPEAGGPTVLVPFTKAIVPVVDIAARRLVIDPPPGLFGDDPREAST